MNPAWPKESTFRTSAVVFEDGQIQHVGDPKSIAMSSITKEIAMSVGKCALNDELSGMRRLSPCLPRNQGESGKLRNEGIKVIDLEPFFLKPWLNPANVGPLQTTRLYLTVELKIVDSFERLDSITNENILIM
ncbi:hypothetical protein F1880_007755 [Penicillium rolfsii]|nr:hypothetical protein F1880_007755 [Penicillium rolfsii]